jgi:phage gpG-like protein
VSVRVSVTVEGIEPLSAHLRQVGERLAAPLDQVLAAIGEDWASVFREHITAGGRPEAFAPLAPSSQARRAGGSRGDGSGSRWGASGGGRPLVDTGALRDSIGILTISGDTLEVGTTLDRAPLLHFGGTTAPGSRIPGANVPPRPFVHLRPEDLDLTFETLELALLGGADPLAT